MKAMPDWSISAMRAAIILLVPVFLVMTNVRLLMTHTFPRLEYNRSSFPPDPYGFTREDRLKWSTLAVDYLLNDRGIDFLAEMKFPDDSPLYNERELSHMVDVKNVVKAALAVWVLSGLLILGSGAALWATQNQAALRAGLVGGALLTLGILGAIVLYILVNFNQFFVQFHQVFFEGGTWMFLYSDTLIRLFPLQFWQDAFIFVGGASIVEALALWGIAWRLMKY